MFGDFTAEFAPGDQQNVRLYFAAIADVHMTGAVFRSGMLELGLDDMAKSAYPLDALMIAGDMTDNGEAEQCRDAARHHGALYPCQKYSLCRGQP